MRILVALGALFILASPARASWLDDAWPPDTITDEEEAHFVVDYAPAKVVRCVEPDEEAPTS